MNTIDKIFIEYAEKIKNQGISEEKVRGAQVRPRWSDGSPAYTFLIPQAMIRYPKGTTPLLSLREIFWKAAIKEVLWIYQDKSNDVALLKEKYGVHYWDEWANAAGNLGKAYGYQINKRFISPETGEETNQIERLLRNIKEDPLNRRHMTTMIDMEDMADMSLVPCAFQTLWTVSGNQLNLTLIQRSGDFLTAAAPGGINAIQYYGLLLMVASVTGYEPGDFVHFIQNLHIYDRHMNLVDKMVAKYREDRPTPKLILNPRDDFSQFTIDDFKVENYEPETEEYDLEIAL